LILARLLWSLIIKSDHLRCHGLAPWSLTLAATAATALIKMPRPCAVEFHVGGYCSNERETPRDCSNERETPREKPVASHAVWLGLILKDHQSRAPGRIVVLVAAATIDNERQNQPSLPRLEMDTLSVPALKSRAKLTRSLPRPGKDGCVIFSKAISPPGSWAD
jgi:hypothetical protein